MVEIRVREIRFVNDGRSLKAFVDIEFGDLVIREFRVVHKTGERIGITPPTISWRDPQTKQIKFKALIVFPPEERQGIEVAILQAYQEEKEKKNGREPEV